MNHNNNNNNNSISIRTRLRSDKVRFADVEAACVSGSVVVNRHVDLEMPVSFDGTYYSEFEDIEAARVSGFVSVRRPKPFAATLRYKVTK